MWNYMEQFLDLGRREEAVSSESLELMLWKNETWRDQDMIAKDPLELGEV